jgi:hypothetical protein
VCHCLASVRVVVFQTGCQLDSALIIAGVSLHEHFDCQSAHDWTSTTKEIKVSKPNWSFSTGNKRARTPGLIEALWVRRFNGSTTANLQINRRKCCNSMTLLLTGFIAWISRSFVSIIVAKNRGEEEALSKVGFAVSRKQESLKDRLENRFPHCSP